MTEYLVAVDDLFRVEADTPEEAEEILAEGIGDRFEVVNAVTIEEVED